MTGNQCRCSFAQAQQLAKVTAEHLQTATHIGGQHDKALTQLTQQHDQLLSQLSLKHEQALAEQQTEHEAERVNLEAQRDEAEHQLAAQQAQHAAQLEAAQQRHEATTAEVQGLLQTALQVRVAISQVQQETCHVLIFTFSGGRAIGYTSAMTETASLQSKGLASRHVHDNRTDKCCVRATRVHQKGKRFLCGCRPLCRVSKRM